MGKFVTLLLIVSCELAFYYVPSGMEFAFVVEIKKRIITNIIFENNP